MRRGWCSWCHKPLARGDVSALDFDNGADHPECAAAREDADALASSLVWVKKILEKEMAHFYARHPHRERDHAAAELLRRINEVLGIMSV